MLTKLREVRLKRGLRLREVAECGVRLLTLSRLERRSAKAAAGQAENICNFLQTDRNELFDGDGLALEA